jgi:saccharopine dehydrogenase-like NADP-dependent oxidoreductase
LELSVPATAQDVVLIFVTVTGHSNGRFVQESYASKVYSGHFAGIETTAIQITTAAGICAILDMLADGTIASHGFVRQEDVPLDAFLDPMHRTRLARRRSAG